jgi:hypothetical protein
MSSAVMMSRFGLAAASAGSAKGTVQATAKAQPKTNLARFIAYRLARGAETIKRIERSTRAHVGGTTMAERPESFRGFTARQSSIPQRFFAQTHQTVSSP